jgi:hypothetical protein
MSQLNIEGGNMTKGELLEHYCNKKPNEFTQYDAFVGEKWHDDIITPNPKTGVAVMCGQTTELMGGGGGIRVLIHKEVTKMEALRGLKEIFETIKRNKHPNDESLYLSEQVEDYKRSLERQESEIPF